MIVSMGTGPPQMLAFARRLRGQLEGAQVTWRGQPSDSDRFEFARQGRGLLGGASSYPTIAAWRLG